MPVATLPTPVVTIKMCLESAKFFLGREVKSPILENHCSRMYELLDVLVNVCLVQLYSELIKLNCFLTAEEIIEI